MVYTHSQEAAGVDGVAPFQLAAFPHFTVDPQLGPAPIGWPGDAVVGPVVGAVAVREVDELVPNPQANFVGVTFLQDRDHEFVLAIVRRVGDRSVDVTQIQQDVHADGKGVQVDRMFDVGWGVAAYVFLQIAEHQRKEALRFWGKQTEPKSDPLTSNTH